MYPGGTGTLTINLRQTQGGPILNTASIPVVLSGLTPVPLNFIVNPGTNYRLEIASSSPQCERNTAGAVWPYTVPGVPLTLTANLTPNANVTGNYYFLYKWEVSTGCKSPRVPVTGTIDSIPAVPVISQNGNLLTSTAVSGNQWYLNGNILVGETNQTLIAATPGSYTVTVTINGCSSTSVPFTFTSTDDMILSGSAIGIYPNPGKGQFTLHVITRNTGLLQLQISEMTGKVILNSSQKVKEFNSEIKLDLGQIAPGIYLVEIELKGNRTMKKLMIQR